MAAPILGAIVAGGARWAGKKAVGWAAKKFSKEGAKKAAGKAAGEAGLGAAGIGGVANPSPAHAPTHTKPAKGPRETSTITPEASKPEPPATDIPNFTYAFGA